MNINLRFPSFKQVLVCLIVVSFMTTYKTVKAQEITAPEEHITYGDAGGKLNDQGYERTYSIYTPKSYIPSHPMPLVLVFHGDDGSGRSISDVTRFNQLAEQQGFIVVYPDGIDQKWRLKQKNKKNINDIAFVDNLLNHLHQIRNIDSNKIYATGFSKGGIFTQVLACHLSDKIAAFASVAGSFPVEQQEECQPAAPVSMLMINGTNDKSVHYDGDEENEKGALISVPDAVDFWREQNQCPNYPATNAVFIPEKQSSNSKVKTYAYSNCKDGSEILHLAVVNGGHLWYGGASHDESINKFNKNLGLNSTQIIWYFFQHHSLSSSVKLGQPHLDAPDKLFRTIKQ
jgi:polyhydroxybutyrate depolymerase